MRRRDDGLTLIELLAAVIILSSAAVAGVRLAQSARGSAQLSLLRLGTIDALDRWRAESGEGERRAVWSWRDQHDRTWRITEETIPLAPADDLSEGASLKLEWRQVQVNAVTTSGEQDVLTIKRIVTMDKVENKTRDSGAIP